jgi:type IV secretion system protein VirB4
MKPPTKLAYLDDVNYRYPAEPMYGFRDSQASKKSFKKFPHGNLCEFISTNPILTGDNQNIVFKRVDGTEKMANMISVKTYGSGTTPLSFKRLLSVDAEFLLTASFAPIMRGAALRRVSRAVKKLEESNDKAVSQHEAIAQLEDDIASEKVSLGEFHTSVMVLADDEESLETACNEIIKIYGESDFRAVVEVMNHEASFLAQFPTNTQYLTRIRLTPSDVFCHFFPFHNFPTGHTHQTHLGEGLCLIDTPSKTPMWFNFHEPEKGAGENDMCPGHGMIVGGNKAGKTTAMLAFDALSEKYGGRTFFFDRDGGAAIYMWATGNKYFEFDSKNIKKFGLNPFKMPDSPENRAFLVDWLCVLSRNEDEISVPSEIKELMVDVVAHAYEELKDMPSLQNLSGVLKPYLPRNFKRMSNIRLWLKGSGIYEDGAFSDYFDNENDDMDFKSSLKTGFDMTAVLETKDQRLITAVMMYLMHRIMGELDGSLMRIFLDEGWFMLDDPWWQNWLKNKLPTARKENFFIVIGTQSPSSILKSPIASMFLDNSAFSIFFANSKADWNTYDKYNITFAEFQTIKNTSRALRHFIYKQGHDSAVCKFNLSGDQFKKPLKILSTNIKTKELARSLRVEFGNDPKDWLPAFYEDNNEGEKT